MIRPDDVNNWRREKGKIVQFFASDIEIANILRKQLPAEFEPYFLIVPYKEKIRRNIYQDRAYTVEIEDFLSMRERGFWKFFLGSSILSPNFKNSITDHISPLCSYNGLINIQQGLMKNNEVHLESTISVVGQVRNVVTKEVLNHKQYARLYKNIHKEILKILIYETIYEFKDGSQSISKEHLMTQGAKDLYERGQINYICKPGNKI